MLDSLLTPKEAAEKLQVPLSWVYEKTRFDAMPGQVRIGKYVRIRESALQKFIESGGEKSDQE
jgi:excisionase family DNA binding protein